MTADNAPGAEERVREYAEAMCRVAHFDGWMPPVALPDSHDPRYRIGACFQCQKAARACVEVERAHVADVWDQGYRFGRLMQFDADWVSRKSLVANLDSAGRTKSNHDNPYRAELRGPEPTEARTVCPECEQGKHGNCNGEAWDHERDQAMSCKCWHVAAEEATP